MQKKLFLFILFSAFLFTPLAQARIDIVPQKIIIGSRDRGGEFTILNLLNAKGTFRIDLLNFRQDENGTYTPLDSPLNSNFNPEEIVRFSPRQFSIGQGGRQKIRLSLRKPADLPEGEYRFHIQALRFAQKDELRRTGSDKNTVSVMMNMGVSIPVIVRHGNTNATAKIGTPTIVDGNNTEHGKPELQFQITREGNASTIGKLDIIWQPQGAQSRYLAQMSNVNIFTEINHRNVKVPLNEMPYGAGTITIRYTDETDKGRVFDEITIQR